jgi:hypothetical protein
MGEKQNFLTKNEICRQNEMQYLLLFCRGEIAKMINL